MTDKRGATRLTLDIQPNTSSYHVPLAASLNIYCWSLKRPLTQTLVQDISINLRQYIGRWLMIGYVSGGFHFTRRWVETLASQRWASQWWKARLVRHFSVRRLGWRHCRKEVRLVHCYKIRIYTICDAVTYRIWIQVRTGMLALRIKWTKNRCCPVDEVSDQHLSASFAPQYRTWLLRAMDPLCLRDVSPPSRLCTFYTSCDLPSQQGLWDKSLQRPCKGSQCAYTCACWHVAGGQVILG